MQEDTRKKLDQIDSRWDLDIDCVQYGSGMIEAVIVTITNGGRKRSGIAHVGHRNDDDLNAAIERATERAAALFSENPTEEITLNF